VVGVGFYLNYVGCKVRQVGAKRERTEMFYLNYVGCKEVKPREENENQIVLSELCGM